MATGRRAGAGRERLVTGSMAGLLVIAVGALSGFYLLMPVVPAYVAGGAGGAGGLLAGLATGALMLGTVLTEFLAPTLIGRYGYRAVLTASLLLLGLPAAALTASAAAPLVLLLCLLRGGGLGIYFVAGSALVAELLPVRRRSEGMGLYGAFIGIPGIVFLPLGVWVSARVGPRPVFLLGAALALAALAAVTRIPAGRHAAAPTAPGPHGDVPAGGADRGAGLLGPAAIFTAAALAGGIVPTFLPLGTAHRWVAPALLVQSCTMPLARWAAGRFGRGDGARLLPPAMLLAAVGLLGAVWAGRPVLLVAGLAVFGAGFGAAQNITFMLMLSRASRADPAGGVRRASMLWNATYDIAMGAGAVAFGALAELTGQRTGFLVLIALIVGVLPLAWREHRAT